MRALAALAVSLVPASSPALEVDSFTLDNGMTFLVVQREGPLVAAGWSVRWGAADDTPGRTGAAHFLEHLLFQGTETIGTRDFARERLLMGEREALVLSQRDDAHAAAAGENASAPQARRRGGEGARGRARNEAERRDMAARIAQIDAELAQLRVPGEASRIYAEAGALGNDAVTHRDLSVYSILVPKQRLELWFWMESDRLLRPVFRGVEGELRVIEEERLQRLESSPIGPTLERFEERFWGDGHPYSWTSDGRRRDWENLVAPGELRRLYDEIYRPERLTAALVGDVDPEQVRAWAELYFGRLPRAGSPASHAGHRSTEANAEGHGTTAPNGAGGGVTTANADGSNRSAADGAGGGALSRAAGEGRGEGVLAATSTVSASAAPRAGSLDESCACRTQVELRFATVPFDHADAVVFDVVAGLLNGRTGRLHRDLVLDRRIAFSATSRSSAFRRAGSFSLFAEALDGGGPSDSPEPLRDALEAAIARLRDEAVSARELEKVKNQITTDAARQIQDSAPLMRRLLIYAGLGDWRHLLDWEAAALAVTPADIQRVARQYLVPERRGDMILRRTSGTSG